MRHQQAVKYKSQSSNTFLYTKLKVNSYKVLNFQIGKWSVDLSEISPNKSTDQRQ